MITLRPAAADDEELLYRLYAGTRADELAAWDAAQAGAFLRMQQRAQEQSYRRQYPAAKTQIVLAEGVGIGRLVTEHSAAAILLIDITLLPAWRGRGIGTALIQALQREAANGGQAVRLHVLAANQAARRLYQRLGFVIEGEPGIYLAMTWSPPTRSAIGSATEHAA